MLAAQTQHRKPTGGDFQSRDQKITRFILSVYNILQDSQFNEIISWSSDGDRFIVKNTKDFAEQILQKYFGHKNLTSFIRQLYFYEFKRCASENNQFSFFHPFFKRDSTPSMLASLRRKRTENQRSTNIDDQSDNFTNNKKILIEKNQASYLSIKVPVDDSWKSQFSAQDMLPLWKSETAEDRQIVQSVPEMYKYLEENILILEDAVNELRAMRLKLAKENSEQEPSIEWNIF